MLSGPLNILIKRLTAVPFTKALLATIAVSALIPAVLSYLFHLYAPNWRWENHPFHATVEGVGAAIAMALAAVILIQVRRQRLGPHFLWVAIGMIGMGMLDGMHAALHVGHSFVWLHSNATLAGGLAFALVVLPAKWSKSKLPLPTLTIFATLLFGLASLIFPQWLPIMEVNGQFTFSARIINFIGGGGFLVAWLYFTYQHSHHPKEGQLLLAHHCLLFGSAALLFEASALWDATWWLWHVLRLAAYAILGGYFFSIYTKDVETIQIQHQSLQQSERNLAKAQQMANLGSCCWDLTTNQLTWSDEAKRIFGEVPHKCYENYEDCLSRIHPDDRLTVKNRIMESLAKAEPYALEYRIIQLSGTERILVENGEFICDDQGVPIQLFRTIHDVTEQKRIEQKLEQLAFYDSLTNLPNRTLLQDRLNQEIKIARRHNKILAVLMLDLDRFKYVNDSLGHSYGDQLLTKAANRIQSCIREVDTLARLGGDEFIIILNDIQSLAAIERIAISIIQQITETFTIQENEIHIGASIGISLYPENGESYEILTKHADIAMYRAKDAGRNTYRFFTEELHANMLYKVDLEKQLRNAIQNKSLQLHYQPRLNLVTGEITGAEALSRWPHPEKGMIPPIEFIPIAEESGLIMPLGDWVLHQACADAIDWIKAGHKHLRVAINLSSRQFEHKDIVKQIAKSLDDHGLEPQYLELEITESMIMKDSAKAIEILTQLKELGVHISVDDFGTGYSSLSYLKRLPINTLKIDKSFIANVDKNTDDCAITSAIISMANDMELEVIAEGVETKEQLEYLQQQGCNQIQGYYFCHPLTKLDLFEFMHSYEAKRKKHKTTKASTKGAPSNILFLKP